jgi:hypothetical protein
MQVEVGKRYKFKLSGGNWTYLKSSINIYLEGIVGETSNDYNVRSVLFGGSWKSTIHEDCYFTAKVKRLDEFDKRHAIHVDEETIKLAEK